MLGNRVLRKIFEPEIKKMMGCWKKVFSVSFINIFCTRHFEDDETKEDEMGRTCSMSGRSLKYVQHIGWKE
jgi:hypothetical protein